MKTEDSPTLFYQAADRISKRYPTNKSCEIGMTPISQILKNATGRFKITKNSSFNNISSVVCIYIPIL